MKAKWACHSGLGMNINWILHTSPLACPWRGERQIGISPFFCSSCFGLTSWSNVKLKPMLKMIMNKVPDRIGSDCGGRRRFGKWEKSIFSEGSAAFLTPETVKRERIALNHYNPNWINVTARTVQGRRGGKNQLCAVYFGRRKTSPPVRVMRSRGKVRSCRQVFASLTRTSTRVSKVEMKNFILLLKTRKWRRIPSEVFALLS